MQFDLMYFFYIARVGFVIMTMIAEMERMRENSVTLNTKRVLLKNSPAKISNAFVTSIAVMVKMTVEITRMRLGVKRITLRALWDNSPVQMASA